MRNCTTCQHGLTGTAAFCPHCGSNPREPVRFSYIGSIVFALLTFLIILVWWASLQVPPIKNSLPVPQQPPDEVATLIARCGSPDSDRVGIPGQPNMARSLTYRKAHVLLVYLKASADSGWKLQSMLDERTLKALPLARAASRLPCLAPK
jgi:hypothetical protein